MDSGQIRRAVRGFCIIMVSKSSEEIDFSSVIIIYYR